MRIAMTGSMANRRPKAFPGRCTDQGHGSRPGPEGRAGTAELLQPERGGSHPCGEFRRHPEQSDGLVVRHPETTRFDAGGRS